MASSKLPILYNTLSFRGTGGALKLTNHPMIIKHNPAIPIR